MTVQTAGRAVGLVSGGLDSVTLAYLLAREDGYSGERLHLLSIDYGQRHRRELQAAARCARALGARHTVLYLRGLRALLHGSALTDGGRSVPDGHYTEASMSATVVPNRNAILLALAYGAAVADGAERVATAVHAGDHAVYPDCRPAFLEAFGAMARLATEGFAHPHLALYTPFARLAKAEIVARGAALGVPFADTWSCYRGGARHCGRCATCVERAEAFHRAGVADLTRYDDPAYWRTAVEEARV